MWQRGELTSNPRREKVRVRPCRYRLVSRRERDDYQRRQVQTREEKQGVVNLANESGDNLCWW